MGWLSNLSKPGSTDSDLVLKALKKSLAVIEFEPDGTIITANQNFLNAMGYRLEEIQGRHHSIFVQPSYAETDEYQVFWQNLGQGKFLSSEFLRVTKAGKDIWIQAVYNPVIDENNRVIKVVKVAIDITKQKIIAANHRGQIDAINRSQAVIEFELDGTIIHANDNFLSVMGYSLDEVKGRHHSMFAPPGVAESHEYKAFWQKLGRGEFDSGEYKRIAKDGSEIWIQASYNPVYDSAGKPFKVVKFATDITQEKQESADIRGQLDAIGRSQAVIEFELDGTIIKANDNFLNTLGYKLEEIQGRHHSMFAPPGVAESREYKDFWAKLGAGNFDSGEYKRIAKDGSEIWIQASYNPIYDVNGDPYKVVKYATDITEQKRLEEEARRAADLAQALKTCQASVMIADNDLKIVYMNNDVIRMFRERESVLRQHFGRFDVDNLIGTCVDDFHKNASHQRSMVEKMSQPYNTTINVGPLVFELFATPWINTHGERLGTIVEWVDKTEEDAIEKEIANVIESASNGDLSIRLSVDDKQGFFKQLSEGLNEVVSISEGVIQDTVNMLDALAHGNLTRRIETEYQGMFDKLKRDANATVEKLTEVIGQIDKSATTVAAGAEEMAQGNADLSQRTEEQASSLEETASSMEQMTATVRQNADNAQTANKLAENAATKAESGGEIVSQAVTSMAEINEASKKIADIIGVIDEIAFQTNLLALNAAVEAARAGEQGRGFAVVAGEVRNLAQRSAAAAKEIKDLIRDSVTKVEDGTSLVNQSGEMLQEIVEAVRKVNQTIGDISVASIEQTSGIEQVNKAVSQMDEMTQQNAALVEEASAAGESMSEQARAMRELLSFFKLSEGSSSTYHRPQLSNSSGSANNGITHKKEIMKPSSSDEEWQEF
ncbi:PAS domain S-box protein [Psychrosphaera ytuae]|uniref:PAS domain S-box protein n=1 Tax=Psychrosphaera ytuae TaxID=2820710 RepID=A0A975D9B4_9GAMM|nr:methyl-accepting chemotaxis protein [Psychrosphaera ytuae]QTH62916.1 PAS domain S-box protein [Psychrosphaera ytuae]